MSEMATIRSAEDKVEFAQEALSAVRTGLEVAEAAEAIVSGTRAVSKRILRAIVVLGLVSLVVYLMQRRQRPETSPVDV